MMAVHKPLPTFFVTALLALALTAGIGMADTLTIDADRQWQFADHLYKSSQFLRAAEEYQRFAFFFPDHPKKRHALLEAGKSFLQARDAQSAQKHFMTLIADKRLDPVSIDAHFQLAETYLQIGAHTHAVLQLNDLITLIDDPAVEDRAYHRIGWIQTDATNWQGALRAFNRISPAGQERYRIPSLIASLNRSGEIEQKNPTLAGTLSIIPGAGQLYCRRYKDAAVAFVLNVGTCLAALDAFDNDQNALGGLLAFIGIGFYSGNIYGAVNDAHKFNAYEKKRYVDELRQHYSLYPNTPSLASFQGLYVGVRVSF